MRRSAHLLLVLLLVAPDAARAGVDCPTVLELHGFLRWGANRCGLTQYNPALVKEAHQCFDQLGSARAAPLMYAGRDQFERQVAVRDLQPFCAEVVRRFPMSVRP